MDLQSDDKCVSRLYVGNLDCRISESIVIKMFSPFGRIVSEEFLWHTRGPKRGAPRGYAFIQYSNKEEARLAKTRMNGRLACGRPLVVRFASEKKMMETTDPTGATAVSKKSSVTSVSTGQMNRTSVIAAIKNKLKALESGDCCAKKVKLGSELTDSPPDGRTSSEL